MINRIDRIEAKEPAGAVAAHEAKAAAHTKAQVGLGNVQDFGIATTAEAQAGTVANKYMTPATTAAAITQQAGAAVSSHTGNKSNPHGVTKAQVGLGSVNDWGATGATNDASDAKYATAGAVKKAYDLAASKAPASHTHDYIPLSGGKMTGTLELAQGASVAAHLHPTSNAIGIMVKKSDGSNYAGGVGFYSLDGGVSGVGFLGWGDSPWDSASGLTVGSGQFTYKGHSVYHAGNKPTLAELGAAPASHNHAWGNITGVPVYATRWPTAAEAGAAPASHNHAWGNITGVPVYATRWPTAAEAGAMADGGTYGTVTCSNWIRTIGATGWYNDSYGGGIHMSDATWVRIYNGKKFHVSNGEADAINTSGGIYAGGNGSFNDVLIRSDRRLKSNFAPITDALNKVSQLHGQIYDKAGVREAGLIAQDVQAVQPESVHENKEGMLTIAPAGVVALLVEAVKELRSENIALKARLDQMGA